ncbi:hypothetical protein DID88_005415 [Monilinia fructigena]|uniref:Uncharacterized protein n=1 Tax=Monilinia fructigena TaxID=38457 RepID=A0A395J525_9HELO|nr:hypothetical protein DID88_005415 [Monilinia fructigena]
MILSKDGKPYYLEEKHLKRVDWVWFIESINVNLIQDYTRSWFAWANSVFAQTILDLAKRKPLFYLGRC